MREQSKYRPVHGGGHLGEQQSPRGQQQPEYKREDDRMQVREDPTALCGRQTSTWTPNVTGCDAPGPMALVLA